MNGEGESRETESFVTAETADGSPDLFRAEPQWRGAGEEHKEAESDEIELELTLGFKCGRSV